MVKDSRAYEYAAWCVADQTGKVPRYVKKQASSWIRFKQFTGIRKQLMQERDLVTNALQ